MTIVDPRTGAARYRVTEDNEVVDLMAEKACDHQPDPLSQRCTLCGLTSKEIYERSH